MRFRLPRPLHGWHQLAYEIVIVVIGVLLALGGAQLLDSVRTRREVASFREAVNHELGRDLGIYQSIMEYRPCVTRRTAELERFLTDVRAGKHDPLARPIGRPFMQTFYFSAWDEKGSETDNLPLDTRIAYGEVYDEFRENEKVLLNEREAWRSLAQFEQPGVNFDTASLLRLRELLSRVEQYNEVTPGNYEYILTLAKPLGIHPIRDNIVAHVTSDESFCRALFALA